MKHTTGLSEIQLSIAGDVMSAERLSDMCCSSAGGVTCTTGPAGSWAVTEGSAVCSGPLVEEPAASRGPVRGDIFLVQPRSGDRITAGSLSFLHHERPLGKPCVFRRLLVVHCSSGEAHRGAGRELDCD